jgi:hypothetical protein
VPFREIRAFSALDARAPKFAAFARRQKFFAMNAFTLSLDGATLGRRLRERLGGGNAARKPIVWERENRRVILHLDTFRARIADGWLVCELEMQNDQVKRALLQFVFFLGTQNEARGTQAAATINATTLDAAQLADQWGADVQRVLWDAVLDAIEASVHQAGQQQRREKITLRGYHCANEALHVEVLAEELR